MILFNKLKLIIQKKNGSHFTDLRCYTCKDVLDYTKAEITLIEKDINNLLKLREEMFDYKKHQYNSRLMEEKIDNKGIFDDFYKNLLSYDLEMELYDDYKK